MRKNISIIIPVKNEPKLIKSCLQSIDDSAYTKENMEIIVINDASTDSTQKEIENFLKTHSISHKIITNEINLGRMATRLKGAKNATHNHLLFIDSRVTIAPESISHLIQSQEKVIIAGDKGHNFDQSPYDRFFFLLRKKIYKNFPQKEDQITITASNFEQSAKGTTACYIDKEIFIKAAESMPKTDKFTNDDTKLFKEIIKMGHHLIRDNAFKISYQNRTNPQNILQHTFHRGIIFTDYYLTPKTKYYRHLQILIAITLLQIPLILLFPKALIYELSALIIIWLTSSIIISEKLKDLPLTAKMIPLVATPFYLGILKGFFLKLSIAAKRSAAP